MKLARNLLKRLEDQGLTLAVAESYTGGRVQDVITNMPGSSKSFLGGVVAYDDGIKRKFLGVPGALLRKHGAVSPEVALAMARGAQQRFKADIGLSTTGIAGPGGATPTKPRGLSFVAVTFKKKAVVERRVLQGSRIHVKDRGTTQALRLALRVVPAKPLRRRRVSRAS